jgi:xylulokinase
LGAARLARVAATGERPEDVCTPPPVQAVVQPDTALVRLFAERRRMFGRLYRDLKDAFVEYSK